jgi:hypothetical protein
MARKPYIVTADWTSGINGQPHMVRTRAEVTGPTGIVDVHVIPEGGFNLWGRFGITRLTHHVTGAPRGWSMADTSGDEHHMDTLTMACHTAASWVLDDARIAQRARLTRHAIGHDAPGDV